MFAVASGALWLGSSAGWTGPTFRVFFLFGAILNVPYLALGTIYLFTGQRTGDRVAVGLTFAAAFAAGVITVAPLQAPISGTDLPTGSDVFGPLPRILAAVGSGGAALVVLGGAVLSMWRRDHRSRAHSRPGPGRASDTPRRRQRTHRHRHPDPRREWHVERTARGLEGVRRDPHDRSERAVRRLPGRDFDAEGPAATRTWSALRSQRSERRRTLPPKPLGSSSTNITFVGHL